MSQLVCCDGFVHAEYDDGITVDLGSAPDGSVVIPWDRVAATLLPTSAPAPDLTAEEMESDDLRAAHVAKYRYAETRLTPVPRTSDQLRAYAGSARYYKSIAGLAINGVVYDTDEDSVAKISARSARAKADDDVAWKARSGFVTLDGSALIEVADRLHAYRDACFAAEASADAGIADGSVKTMADVEAFFKAVAA